MEGRCNLYHLQIFSSILTGFPLLFLFSPWKENQVGLVFAGNIGSNCTNLVHKATLFLMAKPVSEGWG